MADQLKLQAAPLTALQLELKQARLETETMRTRLRGERKETRLRCAIVMPLSFGKDKPRQGITALRIYAHGKNDVPYAPMNELG